MPLARGLGTQGVERGLLQLCRAWVRCTGRYIKCLLCYVMSLHQLMVRVGQHGHAVFGCGGSVVLLLLTMSPGAHDSICDASVWVTDAAEVTGIRVVLRMDSSVRWANGLINWATPSPQGRPMSRFDFRSWTRTLKLVCLFVCFAAARDNSSACNGTSVWCRTWVRSVK